MIIIVTQEKEAKLCYSHSERMHRDNILQYNTKAFNKAYAFLQVTCLPRNRSFPTKMFLLSLVTKKMITVTNGKVQ